MRRLLYFLIIHNQADLGSLKESLSAEGERKYGKAEWENHLKQVEKSWNKIEKTIKQHLDDGSIHFNKIRLYQDGLPIAGETGLKVVKDVAKQGSRNYQILEDLIEHGSSLEEAESKELLLGEYEYISRILKAETSTERLKHSILYQDVAQELLDKRDAYIANRINKTLKENELGILFLGGKHSIIDRLDKDINIRLIKEFKDKISTELMNQG
jgi:hypothetical protein